MSEITELTGDERTIFEHGFRLGVDNALRLKSLSGNGDEEVRRKLEIALHYLRIPIIRGVGENDMLVAEVGT